MRTTDLPSPTTLSQVATRPATIVIGAGPAGLAAAACLGQRGIPACVLERSDSVGASWRSHYRRLHLHTVKELSALPGLPFPPQAPRYVRREQVVRDLAPEKRSS